MKILIIGCHRTRSSALEQYLVKQHPYCTSLMEYYSPLFDEELHNLKQYDFSTKISYFVSNKIKNRSHDILRHENFIIKLLGNHLPQNLPKESLSTLYLEKYNQINLIERHNFYDSCASLEICLTEKVWHFFDTSLEIPQNCLEYMPNYIWKAQDAIRKKYQIINKKQYNVSKRAIIRQAIDVDNYLLIKEYLTEKNISYNLYNYNDKLLSDGINTLIRKNDINYNLVITNKCLENPLNELFNKYFNYQSCKRNLQGFINDLENLVPQKGFEPPTY